MLSVVVAVAIGTVVGLVAGYFGGWIDLILMRITDIFLGFPALILALAIVAVLGPGVVNVSVALIVVFWTDYARVVRASTLALREQPYVLAARTIGASSCAHLSSARSCRTRIGPMIVLATLGLGTAVIAESALGFLGFGVPPPTADLGLDARLRHALHPHRAVALDRRGPRDHDHRARLQPARRRAARHPRSAPACARRGKKAAKPAA